MIVTDRTASHFRILARGWEPVWLRRHLGWTITAPANCNRADWSPVPA